ncbi:hypothetical protein [Actinomycetospora termitidis]|uniref:Uncharacterized protein n=1 Tax=Actinomycetospora termitidis TaxID=3053470 RepID=A0ABT7M2V8_9PSEU|nr:hypothetical protein [Actinomycetospora sp. Odt1-22]MDL5154995.1 hypothetical protein [Actinomycetospora sp. Odt1-22]
MSSWVMAVEVTPSELVAVEVDRAATGAEGAPRRPRTVTVDPGSDVDGVDRLADAFTALLDGAAPPARLVVATPPDTERRRFEEIAEATALVGLPAPSWLPGPVALVGERIAAGVPVGGRAVVLDARDGALTAWPVRRTADGAEIGARGPVATGTRLDQLLLGVVRAQLHSLDPASGDHGGPRPGAREDSDARGRAARLRREVRRARALLADGDADEARVGSDGHTVTVERAVFDQLVEHALRETVDEIERAAGPDDAGPGPVHVLADRPTPLARRLAALTDGGDAALALPRDPTDGVLGMAALLLPARPRAARAASGAQAIRSRRGLGGSPAPVGVGAVAGAEAAGDDGSRTPPRGLPLPGAGREDALVAADRTAVEVEAPGVDEAPAIPAARVPSTPVQAQRGPDEAFGSGAGLLTHPAEAGTRPAVNGGGQGHAALAGARPHEARPTSDAPPGNSGPLPLPDLDEHDAAPSTGTPSGGTAVAAGRRRGPDTAPQPIPVEPERRAPRGAVPVLVVLLLVAVLAAAGVLVLGPDQVSAAFAGIGAGVVSL